MLENAKRLIAISAIIVVMFAASLTVAYASPPNNGGVALTPSECKVTSFPDYTSDGAAYENTMTGTSVSGSPIPYDSWSYCLWALKGTGGNVYITVTDLGYVGDHFEAWYTTSGIGRWTPLGSTPVVYTGPQLVCTKGGDVCPPQLEWTGTGTTYSSATFTLATHAGTAYTIRFRDALFDAMVTHLDGVCGTTPTQLLETTGCSVPGVSVAAYWSPGGFDITFAT